MTTDLGALEKVPSYWKSKNFYDPDLKGFFEETTLTVEEKIDGSQFSFGFLPNKWGTYVLRMTSKNKEVEIWQPEGLFKNVVEYLKTKDYRQILPKDIVFRGEAVCSPRHNKLHYSRTPFGYCVVYGAENLRTATEVPRTVWQLVALEMGMEPVRQFPSLQTHGKALSDVINEVKGYLEDESMLGGPKVEGIVLKRTKNHINTQDGVPMFAKVVSDSFREIAKPKKTKGIVSDAGVIKEILDLVNKDMVYSKAVQHLREEGILAYSNSDIGPLINEIKRDIAEDLKEPAKSILWEWAKNTVTTGIIDGFAQWYIKKLKGDAANEDVDASNAGTIGEGTDSGMQSEQPSTPSEDPIAH